MTSSLIRRVLLSVGVIGTGQWLLSDVLHIPGGGLGIAVAATGLWWLSRPPKPPGFREPTSLKAWIERCERVLNQFAELEEVLGLQGLRSSRETELRRIEGFDAPLTLGVVATEGSDLPATDQLQQALVGVSSLDLCLANPLPVTSTSWCWPDDLQELDVLLHVLSLPLRAADLLWLDQLPADRPVWLLLRSSAGKSADDHLEALRCQLPERWHQWLLPWSGQAIELRGVLQPVRQQLMRSERVRQGTRQRLLSNLHRRWQADLETLRRERFRLLLQRSQWIVAGVVIASPVPSVDLLAVAVGNGLMVKEMATIWSCPWSAEVLQVVARQLGSAALAQGVVELSGQALLGLAKLDGASWIAAGAMQGLSAAYLTRVVGVSLADWMALNAGVAEPDLEELKRQAPLLVARAAEQERLNLAGFARQAREWIEERNSCTTA
ncbi:YcjF family protein [Synechococcus sp. MIT S9509]|uniref:YcjF family protein n=1 Tax=Synechococcus sp. MIT S9509 TaxID=1801630 RepID=UPI000834616C|nr:YcjF family protein [Synechococcus sp. MIT S9509]